MAITNQTIQTALTTTSQTLYTCPANKVAAVITFQVNNIGESNTTVAAQRNGSTFITNVPCNYGSAVGLITGKVFLSAGETIEASAGADGAAVSLLSVYEVDVV